MRAADGTPCPMHRDDGARDCSIRGTCSAPATAIAGLLAQPALVPAFVTLPPDRLVTVNPLPPRASFHFGSIQPDPPPPRG
jgi:hypothetical protein